MNCPKCGNTLPAGVSQCPVCGTPLTNSQGFDPTAFQTGGYQGGNSLNAYQRSGWGYNAAEQSGFDPTTGAQNGFTQGYNGYPQGYQQVYGAYNARRMQDNAFISALGNLPRVLKSLFRDPGETLRGMMERNDLYTGGVMAGLSLLLTFFAAIFLMRGAIYGIYAGLMTLSGTAAGSADSMSQGVNYIAGKMAASVGGIAALCQLIALLFPAGVTMVYLCVVKKVRFSFLLLSNLTAIVTLPSVGASLLCMIMSLLSPYLGALMILIGLISSYALLSALITWITGQPEQRLVPTKIAVIGLSEALKILFVGLVGGTLTTAALGTVSSLVNSMGSLL